MFNLDDFTTVPQAGVTRIPPDSDVVYIRLRGVLRDGSTTSFGPIFIIPPYDFFGVTVPFLTTVGNAPDLATNGVIPDVLGEGALNLHLPYFSGTFNIKNFSQAQGGSNLFFSLSAGMTPSILEGQVRNLQLQVFLFLKFLLLQMEALLCSLLDVGLSIEAKYFLYVSVLLDSVRS